MIQLSTLAGAFLALATLWFLNRRRRSSSLPLPPGPKGLPLIGVVDIPIKAPWLVYEEWTKKYGDMIYLESFGSSMLILNSARRVKDLLDRRSAKYSSRPRMVMIREVMGYTHNLGLMPYDDQWRRHRRVFHENFHDDSIFQYHPTLMRETHTFLHDLLSSADNLAGRIRYLFGAEILDIVYGIRLDGPDDPYLLLIEEVAKGFDYATRSGIFLVEVIPAMKYIPKWFPGASFQRSAAHYKKMATLAQNKPFNHAKRALVDGTAKPSIVTRMIQAMADDLNRESEETTIRQVLSVAYSSGVDTTSAAFEAFFILMSKHPEVQKKAHAELEAVVGPDRLPTFDDRESLHYINAIIRELLRWMPVAPLGLPHLSTEADVYDGYFIPEGTAVFGNLWAILRDPEMYPNPAQFQPERYLRDGRLNLDGVLDPFSVVFGFGRRICPGKAFAEGAIYITVAAVLATFDILPPLDDNGQSIELSTDGAVVQPISCKCIVKPRSKAAADLIRACVAQDVT